MDRMPYFEYDLDMLRSKFLALPKGFFEAMLKEGSRKFQRNKVSRIMYGQGTPNLQTLIWISHYLNMTINDILNPDVPLRVPAETEISEEELAKQFGLSA